jgi:hypothetical protein
MVCRTAIALFLLSLAAAAHADTANVREGQSQLRFLPAAAAASGGSTANRAPASPDKEAMFRRLDIDGDGFVSKAEAAGNEPATLGFDRADRNRDGKLSRAEYERLLARAAAKSAGTGSTSPAKAKAKKKD